MLAGRNTAGVALMVFPQRAAAILNVDGSTDGRTLQVTFQSVDRLSLIKVMVVYQPPTGRTQIKRKQNQIMKYVNK